MKEMLCCTEDSGRTSTETPNDVSALPVQATVHNLHTCAKRDSPLQSRCIYAQAELLACRSPVQVTTVAISPETTNCWAAAHVVIRHIHLHLPWRSVSRNRRFSMIGLSLHSKAKASCIVVVCKKCAKFLCSACL